jgi:phospholipase/carboxylesterase
MPRQDSTPNEELATGLKFTYRPGANASAPLVVLIHGRAGDRSVMWTFERIIPEQCHIIAFQAFLPDQLGGWSWWDMTEAGSKREAILAAAGRLSRALRAFLSLYQLNPARYVGLGFSQGAGLLSAVALGGMFDFDAIAVLAGFVFQPSEGVKLKKRPRVFIAHGSLDERISVAQARDGVAALERQGFEVQYVEEGVGHKVGIEGTRALKVWVTTQQMQQL